MTLVIERLFGRNDYALEGFFNIYLLQSCNTEDAELECPIYISLLALISPGFDLHGS